PGGWPEPRDFVLKLLDFADEPGSLNAQALVLLAQRGEGIVGRLLAAPRLHPGLDLSILRRLSALHDAHTAIDYSATKGGKQCAARPEELCAKVGDGMKG